MTIEINSKEEFIQAVNTFDVEFPRCKENLELFHILQNLGYSYNDNYNKIDQESQIYTRVEYSSMIWYYVSDLRRDHDPSFRKLKINNIEKWNKTIPKHIKNNLESFLLNGKVSITRKNHYCSICKNVINENEKNILYNEFQFDYKTRKKITENHHFCLNCAKDVVKANKDKCSEEMKKFFKISMFRKIDI